MIPGGNVLPIRGQPREGHHPRDLTVEIRQPADFRGGSQ
jgi:hypothetical protein